MTRNQPPTDTDPAGKIISGLEQALLASCSEEDLQRYVEIGWKEALRVWNHPTIPAPKVLTRGGELNTFSDSNLGTGFLEEFALMDVRSYQTYVNGIKASRLAPDDIQKTVTGLLKHEIGHRACPYDSATATLLFFLMQKRMKNVLEGNPAHVILTPNTRHQAVIFATKTLYNLWADQTVNSHPVRIKEGDEIIFIYQQLTRVMRSPTWLVYARSMELAWNCRIREEGGPLEALHEASAANLAKVFAGNPLDSTTWPPRVESYTDILGPYLLRELSAKLRQDTETSQASGGRQPGDMEDADSPESSPPGITRTTWPAPPRNKGRQRRHALHVRKRHPLPAPNPRRS